MLHVSINVTEEEKKWIKKLEDEYDLATVREYKAKGAGKTYTMSEVAKKLGFEDEFWL